MRNNVLIVERYRAVTPKARLIPLTQPFVDYLRADGIILPAEEVASEWSDSDSGIFSGADDADGSEDEDVDVAAEWRPIHNAITSTIAELDGRVVPKLNWSAPKDATWINATNSMDCRNPADIYLLLKSSDFVTHDLEHAFDGCSDISSPRSKPADLAAIPYHLVLRKHILMNPSVEFRCFVRNKRLLGICQRDLNHYDFLNRMRDALRERIEDFFEQKLKTSFPDDNYAFDVYIPPPHQRVWLIDINPWAPRTDPLLFSWLELLTMDEPPAEAPADGAGMGFVRLSLNGAPPEPHPAVPLDDSSDDVDDDDDDSDSADEEIYHPEFRLINRDDPEAYSFNTPQYSAHKLPRDVVDASQAGPGQMREFAERWKEVLAKRQRDEEKQGSDADDDEDDDDAATEV